MLHNRLELLPSTSRRGAFHCPGNPEMPECVTPM